MIRDSLRCEIKAVLSLLLSSIPICQYHLLASNIDETVSLPSEFMCPFIRANEYEPRSVTAFSLRLLTQEQKFPSYLGTNTMAAAYSVRAGSTMFLVSVLYISTFSPSLVFRPGQYGTDCMGIVSGFGSLKRCTARMRCPR